MKNLFINSIPLVDTSQDIKKIRAQISNLKQKYSQYDEDYVVSSCLIDRKKWAESLWQIYQEYTNSNFIREFNAKGKFRQRSWELYLGAVFLKRNLMLVRKSAEGPDFHLLFDGIDIWIEATAPTKGKYDPAHDNSIPENGFYCSRTFLIQDDLRPRAVRLLSAIRKKCKSDDSQYRKGINSGSIKQNDPYVIAINGYEFADFTDTNALLRLALCGLGNQRLTLNARGELIDSYFEPNPHITAHTERGSKSIECGIFASGEYSEVSAILFSSAHLFSQMTPDSELVGSSITMVCNPFAKNPLPKDFPVLGNEMKISI